MTIDEEIASLFHNLWTRDVGTEGYDKEKWMKLLKLLDTKDVHV